jgi:hypothetical protein
MFFYIHHGYTDAGQNVHVDVPLCHTGDLVPYYTQHKYTYGPQQMCVDVHSEESAKKINNIFVKMTNIKFHENLSVGNLITPTWKEN